MARTGIRLMIASAGVIAAGMSALLCAGGIALLEAPEQRVGLHLEFSGKPARIREDVATARVLLRRLLASTDAQEIAVSDVDPSTLSVTFMPADPWSEEHGLLAEGTEAALALVPDELHRLLTTARDVRILEVAESDAVGDADIERRRFLEVHPDLVGEAFRRSLVESAPDGRTITWCPLGADGGELVPLLAEGEPGRRIALVDLSWASRGSGPPDVEIRVDAARRNELGTYLEGLVGRHAAIVVDGAIDTVARVHAYERNEIGLVGADEPLSEAQSSALVDRIRRPPLPSTPRITRSWIAPTSSRQSAHFAFGMAVAVGLAALVAVWAFVRDVRRPPARPVSNDWSSGA